MKKILLLLIIILAFLLRFYRLGDYPALNADEAAIGYNAYSLIQTGKDEHGNAWPISFQSFNDYKPGLYFYLVLPFVKVMGLNEWSVRLPNALLGVATVYLIYLLIKELGFKNSSEIAAFMLAISPWHIHFSRGGWEVNTATFFITLGVYLFIKGLKKPVFWYFSALALGLSLYTYHAARVVVPLLGFCLLLIYRKDVKKHLGQLLFAMLFSLILLLPLAKDILSPAGISRVSGVGLFSDPGPFNRTNEQRGEHADFQGNISKILHNKVVNYGLAFIENWGEHYRGEFLFLTGDDIQRDKVPETGQMYLFDILFIAAGLMYLLQNFNKSTKLIFCWVAIAPIAAAFTFQSPHALRSHNMVIPLVIISALGLINLLNWLKSTLPMWIYIATSGVVLILIILNFSRYAHMYWVHMAKEYPYSSQYGVKELVSYLQDNSQKYNKIIVTDRYDQPYVLFLFYLKYPPEKFQNSHILTARDNYGFSTVRDFDKYHFETIDFDKVRPENPNSLIVGTKEEIPKEANIVKKIYGSNGYEYFDLVAN